jgi:hypothetical protein
MDLVKHLVDFLLANPGPAFLNYRRRCLALWEETYGETVVAKVKARFLAAMKGKQ